MTKNETASSAAVGDEGRGVTVSAKRCSAGVLLHRMFFELPDGRTFTVGAISRPFRGSEFDERLDSTIFTARRFRYSRSVSVLRRPFRQASGSKGRVGGKPKKTAGPNCGGTKR